MPDHNPLKANPHPGRYDPLPAEVLALDQQTAVVHAVAIRLARNAWREDNARLPAVHSKPWESATPNQRAPYMAHALAAAADLVVCGLLASRLPDVPPPAPADEQET